MNLQSLPDFTGPAYRADTGYQNDRDATAADVLRYEIDELGNDHQTPAELMDDLSQVPARKLTWVARTRHGAARYGEPEEMTLPAGTKIVSTDPHKGVLVLVP